MTGRCSADVVVIGGGIVGASCAYFLTAAGASVILLERDALASGTSGACQSHVSNGIGSGEPSYSRAALEVHAELRGSGIDEDYRLTGGLFVAMTGEEAIALAGEVSRLRTLGIETAMLDPAQVRELEPNLTAEIAAAAFEPLGGQINPMSTVMGLAVAASHQGARLVFGADVSELRTRGRDWAIVTPSHAFAADHVVIAAGPWSRLVGQLAGVQLPVWPRKGHVIVTEPRPGWLRNMVFEFGYEHSLGQGFGQPEEGAAEATASLPANPPASRVEVGTIIQPLAGGQMLVGNSRESAGWDRTVDRSRLGQIAARAVHLLPRLRGVRAIRSYAGLRPWSPDGRPLVGPCQRLDGLWLATGHGGGGITEGPLAGRLISQLINGESPMVDITPLLPDRFGPRLYAEGI